MYQRAFVPVDGSQPSKQALLEAIKVATLTRGAIRLAHVINEYAAIQSGYYSAEVAAGMREQGESLLRAAQQQVEKQWIVADTVLLDGFSGPTGTLLVDAAQQWGADLIVMGTHGRRGLSRLTLGSDAENVVRRSTVPVLLVRDAGGDSPA